MHARLSAIYSGLRQVAFGLAAAAVFLIGVRVGGNIVLPCGHVPQLCRLPHPLLFNQTPRLQDSAQVGSKDEFGTYWPLPVKWEFPRRFGYAFPGDKDC